MSRALSENKAMATIVRGFLGVDMPGLPEPLKAAIDNAMPLCQQEMMQADTYRPEQTGSQHEGF